MPELLLQGRQEPRLSARFLSSSVVSRTSLCLPTKSPDSQDVVQDQEGLGDSHPDSSLLAEAVSAVSLLWLLKQLSFTSQLAQCPI